MLIRVLTRDKQPEANLYRPSVGVCHAAMNIAGDLALARCPPITGCQSLPAKGHPSTITVQGKAAWLHCPQCAHDEGIPRALPPHPPRPLPVPVVVQRQRAAVLQRPPPPRARRGSKKRACPGETNEGDARAAQKATRRDATPRHN